MQRPKASSQQLKKKINKSNKGKGQRLAASSQQPKIKTNASTSSATE